MSTTFTVKWLLVINLIVSAKGTSEDDYGYRIVGGTTASISNFPYQISLRFLGSHMCGGAIISQQFILTAAHCVEEVLDFGLTIRAGSSRVDQGGVIIRVCSVISHEKYDEETFENDIAILKLCEPLAFSNYILPVALPKQTDIPMPKVFATITGWGYRKEEGEISPILRQAKVPIVGNKLCKQLYAGVSEIVPTMICAGYLKGGKDSCQGDSGGPALINGRLGGIVSFGYGCGRAGYPGVYTNVAAMRNWIRNKINY